jgi:hypothetical protein
MIGFQEAVRYFELSVATIVLSGVFVLLAVINIFMRRPGRDSVRMPSPVGAFMISASIFPLSFVLSVLAIPWQIRFQETAGGLDLEGLLWILTSAVTFVCLLATVVQLRRTSGPGTKVSTIGSTVLVVVYMLQFVAVLSGYVKPE